MKYSWKIVYLGENGWPFPFNFRDESLVKVYNFFTFGAKGGLHEEVKVMWKQKRRENLKKNWGKGLPLLCLTSCRRGLSMRRNTKKKLGFRRR